MLTERAAAERLGVSVKTLQAWRQHRADGPPYVKVGPGPKGAVRYPEAALDEWLRTRLHGAVA